MNATSNNRNADLLTKVTKAATGMAVKADRAKVGRLVRAFYSNTSRQDLSERTVDELAGSTLAIMAFGNKRRAGNALLRVYNPEKKKNGWDIEHTIIEAVTDDMPFLVDSITSELGSRGITLRIIRDAKGKGDVLKIWSKKNEGLMDQTAQMLSELEADDVVDLSMLAVASRQLSSIVGG